MVNNRFFLLLILVMTVSVYEMKAQIEENAQIITPFLFKTRRLAPILMESTFFISGPPEQKVTGTAFLLGHIVDVDSSTLSIDSTYYKSHSKLIPFYGKGRFVNILVTAAHIFHHIQGDEAYLQLRRINSNNDYEVFSHKINIRHNGVPLWTQPANKSDVAVMYVTLPLDARYKVLADSFLATDSK